MPKITSNEGKPYAELGTLLRNLRLRRGLSQVDVATGVGINNSYLSRLENGERRPSPKILRRFAEILNHPYEELVVASGILSPEFVRSTPGGLGLPPTNWGDPLQQQIYQMQRQEMTNAAMQRRGIPIFDTVPAGLLKDANVVAAHDDVPRLVLTEEELSYDPSAFALVVKGDSMVEAGILDGDVVVVSPKTPVGNGEIGVVQIDRTGISVKRVIRDGSMVVLQPANSNYLPQIYTNMKQVEVLGKVVLVRRKLY